MSKYQSSKIYKITDIGYNKCYIGSTYESLAKRMVRHRSAYNDYLSGKSAKIRSYCLFDEYGIANCKIELIEHFPCNTKDELRKREGYYIKETDCVNKQIAGRTKEEYREDFKDYLTDKIKEWNEINKDYRREYEKSYKNKRKEHIQEYLRDYNEKNKEQIKELKKNNYLKHREELNTKVVCECGASVAKQCLKRHYKTKKHQDSIKS